MFVSTFFRTCTTIDGEACNNIPEALIEEAGFLSVYFSRDDVHRTTFYILRNVNKMAAWIADNIKR